MQPNSRPPASDEIDIGQLFQLIRKGLNGIFRGILKVFLFLKRNAIILLVLLLIGVGIGFLLNTLVDDKLQTEVIVKPNFESKDYLYSVVEELQSKISSKDTLFFKEIDIDIDEIRSFKLKIDPIEEKFEMDKEMIEENNKYLEILQNYKDDDFFLDVIKSEILKKSAVTHRITFTHKNPIKGEEYVSKILNYINSNPFFQELQKVHTQNALSRIKENTTLIGQIDDVVKNFSEGLKNAPNQTGQGLLLESDSGTDISGILSLKSHLSKVNERKQMELAEQKEAISILSLGKSHVEEKPLFNKNIVLIPLLLLGLFFLVSLISYLNKKSLEIQ